MRYWVQLSGLIQSTQNSSTLPTFYRPINGIICFHRAVQWHYIDKHTNDTVPNHNLLQPITKLYLTKIMGWFPVLPLKNVLPHVYHSATEQLYGYRPFSKESYTMPLFVARSVRCAVYNLVYRAECPELWLVDSFDDVKVDVYRAGTVDKFVVS